MTFHARRRRLLKREEMRIRGVETATDRKYWKNARANRNAIMNPQDTQRSFASLFNFDRLRKKAVKTYDEDVLKLAVPKRKPDDSGNTLWSKSYYDMRSVLRDPVLKKTTTNKISKFQFYKMIIIYFYKIK